MPSTKRAIRQAFDQAAAHYDAAASLQHEVARRLDEKLDWMKFEPHDILDAGCGTGFALPGLAKRYPQARLIGLDLSSRMLEQARTALPQSWWQRVLPRRASAEPRFTPICADLEQLPLASNSLDLAWSNLALQWVGDLEATLRGLHRVLRPGGLLLFSTFGPDTLKELRAAFADLDGYNHVNRFIDMHDIGDMLMHAGFKNPVMEMEYLTLTYSELAPLLRELKAIGAHTVLGERRPGLMGKHEWQRLQDNYARFRSADGRLPATYEVIYGHAWVGDKSEREDGRQVIQWQIARKRGGL